MSPIRIENSEVQENETVYTVTVNKQFPEIEKKLRLFIQKLQDDEEIASNPCNSCNPEFAICRDCPHNAQFDDENSDEPA